jgi:hypothetical protein
MTSTEVSEPITASTRQDRDFAMIPKDWSSAPIFSPRKQLEPRQIIVNGNTWRMGIDNPLNNQPFRPIDMGHVRILLAVLSFWNGNNPLSMSLSELGRRAAGSHGGAYFKLLRQKLGDLRDYWIAVDLQNGNKRMFPAISRIEITTRSLRSRKESDYNEPRLALDEWGVEQKQPATERLRAVQLDNVALAPEFAEFLCDWTNIMHVRLDVLRRLASDLAQAIYLFIPSRAVHHAKEDPWKINLANLYDQLGMNVPVSKSLRKKALVQHGEKSMLKQLNNVPILHGYLRVSLRLNKEKSDWLFLAWVEGRGDLPDLYSSESALVDAWRKSGRDEAELAKLLRNALPELTDEELYLCEAAKIQLPNVKRFIQLWLNSNKGTKSDMEVCPSPYSPKDYAYVASPNYRHHSSSQFWKLESRRLSPEICCHESPSPLATTCRSASIVAGSLLAKWLRPEVYRPVTTGSK